MAAKNEKAAAQAPDEAAPEKSPTEAYLEAIGVKGVDLSTPSAQALAGPSEIPTDWRDKNGERPPPGLELFLVPADARNIRSEIRAAEQKGYRKLDGDHGLRWEARPEQEGDVVMARTKETKTAWLQAKAAKRAARLNRKRTTTTKTPSTGGEITESVTIRDAVKVKQPELRT